MLCFDCPRNCGVDRSKSLGFCQEGDLIHVCKVIENFMWEEPCLCHDKGALAIFFGGCNLRCEYCQNVDISQKNSSKINYFFNCDEFLAFLSEFDLTKYDCIDLITPTHFSSQLLCVLSKFSCPIPIVWNSSGYEKVKMLGLLAKYVDIFLFDYKYSDDNLAKKFSLSHNYSEIALNCIKNIEKIKKIRFEGKFMKSGVIVRHLILPGYVQNSLDALENLAKISKDVYISLMSQFTPNGIGTLNRKITPLEYKIVLSKAQKLGFKNGFYQELTSSSNDFVPNF